MLWNCLSLSTIKGLLNYSACGACRAELHVGTGYLTEAAGVDQPREVSYAQTKSCPSYWWPHQQCLARSGSTFTHQAQQREWAPWVSGPSEATGIFQEDERAKRTYLRDLLLEPKAYFFGSAQLRQVLGLLGQLGLSEPAHSELQNKGCCGGGRNAKAMHVHFWPGLQRTLKATCKEKPSPEMVWAKSISPEWGYGWLLGGRVLGGTHPASRSTPVKTKPVT